MNKAVLFFFVIMLYCSFLTAQTDTIPQLVSRLEASSDNAAAISTITELLKSKDLTQENQLALQTALVHKYQALRQWDRCVNYCQQQINLAHQQKNTLAEASFYKHLGSTYYYIPQKQNAIAYWKKCIAIAEPNKYNTLLAQCYHNVGVISLEEADFNAAEKYFSKAIDLSKQNNDTASATFSLHYRLLATTYETENKLDKAEEIFQKIITKSRAAKDSANLAESLLFYTNVLKKKNEFEKAILFSQEALAIARKINLVDGVITTLDTHSGNLAAAQNYKEAYKYKSEEDSIVRVRFSNDLNSKISEAEAKFKNAEAIHEKEVAVLKARKEKQIYIASIIGILIAAGSAFFYLNQKRKYRKKIEQLKMQQQLQEEKERLSRDLHDNLGSQMALLSNNIETLDINFKKQLDIDGNIERVKGTSRQLLQTLREAIWILNKEQVTAQEFFDKLIDYAQRYLQSYPGMQLKVQEIFEGDKQLNSNEALQLFRICQEAVTNACKYSGSEVLLLKGETANNNFTVTIQDFGKGFETAAVNSNGHYGLKNMQQRAASVHAAIKINTSAGGVSIAVTL